MVTLILFVVGFSLLLGLSMYGRFEDYFTGAFLGLIVGGFISLIVGLCLRTTTVTVDQQRLSPVVSSGEKQFYLKLDDVGKYSIEYVFRTGGTEKTITDSSSRHVVVFEETDQPYVIHYQVVLRRNQWLKYVFFCPKLGNVYEAHVPQGSVYIAWGSGK